MIFCVKKVVISGILSGRLKEEMHDFIRRSPQEYKDWIDGVRKECEILELRMLPDICDQGKMVFVDTNISIETLRKLSSITGREEKR